MKIKTSALLFSAFFVTSVLAVNAVQDEGDYLMDSFNDANFADYEEDEVIIMETKEDKARIREAKRLQEQQRKEELAKQQAEAEKLKVAEGTDKAQEDALKQAPIAEENADTDQQVALSTEQQLKNQRKALDLGPPIPPGTFGGGNGNGGPGAEQPSASEN